MSHEEDLKAEKARGYSLGYAAGLRKVDRDNYHSHVKNDRATRIASSLMAAFISNGQWGEKVSGVHIKHDVKELEDIVARTADRLVSKLRVY